MEGTFRHFFELPRHKFNGSSSFQTYGEQRVVKDFSGFAVSARIFERHSPLKNLGRSSEPEMDFKTLPRNPLLGEME